MKNKSCIQYRSRKREHGFTLVEIAVVLVLIGLLLGSFIGSLTQRIETTQRENTKKQLADIRIALIGHAISEGRLPCPTSPTGNGLELPNGGSTNAVACTVQHGFIPGRTLGIMGSYNRDNLLVDVWGNPFRYSVTTENDNAFTSPASSGGIADLLLQDLTPDLNICSADSVGVAANTCIGVDTLIDNAPFVVLSLGKDGSDFITNVAPNSDQGENSGEAVVAANAAGENIAYTVGSGNAFVNRSYSSVDAAAGPFDDMIIWVSPYILYARMMEAGQL